MKRRDFLTSAATFIGGAAATLAAPGMAAAQEASPNAATIERQLSAKPQRVVPPKNRVTIEILKQRRDLRRVAPSIDIRSINFASGSARIAPDQYWKVEEIAIALRRILRRNPREIFLIEGHTDAVGSRESNYYLSQARAASVARVLDRFGVPGRALETIGYGEDDLLVPTQRAEYRNRRVTIRRVTEFVTQY